MANILYNKSLVAEDENKCFRLRLFYLLMEKTPLECKIKHNLAQIGTVQFCECSRSKLFCLKNLFLYIISRMSDFN